MPQARTHWYYTKDISNHTRLYRFELDKPNEGMFCDIDTSEWYPALFDKHEMEECNRLTKAEARYRFPSAFKK